MSDIIAVITSAWVWFLLFCIVLLELVHTRLRLQRRIDELENELMWEGSEPVIIIDNDEFASRPREAKLF